MELIPKFVIISEMKDIVAYLLRFLLSKIMIE